jgi:integrase/recombinase XerD
MDILNYKRQLWIELKLRGYAESTRWTYCSTLETILKKFCHKETAYDITIDELKAILLKINNRNYHKQMVATIHRFYELVLKKKISLQDIPYPAKTKYLPVTLSVPEVFKLISVTQNLKHKAMLQLSYSCALRVGELITLELSDFNKHNLTLHIKGAKGFKDRIVPVPAETMNLLREYYLQYKPKKYLFEGQLNGEHYSERSAQLVLRASCRRAGIKRYCTVHTLRHSRATHLIDNGVDISFVSKFLGHAQIKTTHDFYIHTSVQSMQNIFSPDSATGKNTTNIFMLISF